MTYYRVKQSDATDCGAACLASVAAYYRLKIQVSKIRQYAGTNQNGTTMFGLAEAATKLGFEAKGVKTSPNNLKNILLPAIAHLKIKEFQHYVVIYKVTKNYVLIMDPSSGKISRIKWNRFEAQWAGILLLIFPSESFTQTSKPKTKFSRFWYYLKPHRPILVQVIFGAIVYTILGLSTSIFIQQLTDHVLVNNNRNLLINLSVAMLLIVGFQTFLGTAKNLFVMRTGQQIDAKLIFEYYRHLLKLPQTFFDTMRVGEIISRINDAVKIRTLINDVAINIVVNLLIVIFVFAALFTSYWRFAVLLLLAPPIYIIIFLIINRLNKKIARKIMEKSAEFEMQLIESLSAMDTIKKFRLENFNAVKTEGIFINFLNSIGRSGKISIYAGSTIEFISSLFTILLLCIGAKQVMDKEISPGQLFSFYALMHYFTGPILSLITSSKTIQEALIAADRLFEIMDLEPEKEDKEKIKLGPTLIGNINFQDVSFRYGTRIPIFDKLNLQVKKGNFTAIVGESGSGKSTLTLLLQQIYPLQSGSIKIGDYSIDQFDKDYLNKLIAVVPQKIDLFAGNLIDNIALGEYQPNLKLIIDICNSLAMLPFIESLPQGLNTYLGENGSLLSGGQKQRIAIARALYKQPEILVLDEATSSLDSDSENQVRTLINLLIKQQKTVIVIAHRLTTIQKADEIIVLKNGVVVEHGNHHQLMTKQLYYYELWQKQFSG
jgi:ABC-type bacteriocin transporter